MYKKVSLIIFLFGILSNGATAQERNTIKVSSRVIYLDPEPVFTVDISLSGSHLIDDNNVLELNQIKEDFKNKIEESGLSWADVQEYPGPFGFETMGYNSLGIIYQYKTKSAKNMKRFLNIRLPTLNRLDMRSAVEIDAKEREKITQMAFEKSLKQATLLARTMKKQVGTIIAVEESSNLFAKPYAIGLYYNRPPGEFLYDIEVTYELK